MRKDTKKIKQGYGLVEIIVGSSIVATVLVGAVFAVNSIRELDNRTTSVIRTNYLLLEGVDVLKIFRDDSWSSKIAPLTIDTPHYLVWESGGWFATTTSSIIDGRYYRTVSLSSVNRDINDNISTSGVLDPGTRKITAIVEWSEHGASSTRKFETYITDLYAN